MDEYDIAQEIVMERMVHKGSFLVLEGKTDIKRFRPFIEVDQCSMVNCQSVRKATRAMALLKGRQFAGALAVIDADFSRVLGEEQSEEDIVVSEFHDLDLDWINTAALEKYLNEVADDHRVALKGGSAEIVNKIHTGLRPVSAGRYLNRKRVFNFKTSGINVGKFFCSDADLCQDYAEALAAEGYVQSSQVDWIVIEIRSEMEVPKDDWQMTNGHDFCGALGAMLQSEIGNRKIPQTWASEVESHIRLAFDKADFQSLKIFDDIMAWEKRNNGYQVVQKNLNTCL